MWPISVNSILAVLLQLAVQIGYSLHLLHVASIQYAVGRNLLQMLDALEQVHCVAGGGCFSPLKSILFQYLLYYI